MTIHLLFAVVTLAGPTDGCTVLHSWMERAATGFEESIPRRLDQSDLPSGPDVVGFHVEGGAASGARAVEFIVVAGDTVDTGAVRSAWIRWIESCTRETRDWAGEEIDIETEIRAPASKALGQFPLEAYIREDRITAGLRYRNAESGAGMEVLTDPTAISSRTVAAGYEGPRVVLIIRIEAAQ